MHGTYVRRKLETKVKQYLKEFPVVAILGPRQCGKSTLALHIISKIKKSLYLDLERPSDKAKLNEPEMFFDLPTDKLVCLDEIQRTPELFPVLRSIVDERDKNGQFLVLGSASPDLIKQSSESLAGRIGYLELTPFQLTEIDNKKKNDINDLWFKGGFPKSYLARSVEASMRWRENFIITFLERDIPTLGYKIPAETLSRFWQMCAHNHGGILNLSKIGTSLR